MIKNSVSDGLNVNLFDESSRNDIVSVATICTTAQLIFPFSSYPTCCVASLLAGLVGCILYNM